MHGAAGRGNSIPLSPIPRYFLIYPPPPYAGVMGCGAAEATGLGFICFVVINPSRFGVFCVP